MFKEQKLKNEDRRLMGKYYEIEQRIVCRVFHDFVVT
jgi:hypothetical protein